MKGLLEEDRRYPPEPGGIIITGSSSAAFWYHTDPLFHRYGPSLRAFPGSETSVIAYYAEQIIVPTKPRYIIAYAGGNDLAAGRSPSDVLAAWKEFVRRARFYAPQSTIIIIGLKPSLLRWALHPIERQTDQVVKEWITKEKSPKLIFIDRYNSFLGKDLKPIAELYEPDGQHLSEKGYAIWSKAILPLIHLPDSGL